MNARPSDISDTVLVRPADERDIRALVQLAELDSSEVPAGPLVVAEIDGRLVAALAVHTRELISDPFVHSDRVVKLLEVLADGRAERDRRPRRGIFGRYARRAYA